MAERQSRGFVSLVGAGPGDPGLLTVRGLERLREADVVVHDHLVSPAVVALARPAAERVYAGKWAGSRAMSQQQINELLVDRARLGRRVVRLKGGDPFLFGRGGEEATWLAERGIPFEVVPGPSAAIAVPAYAGIPVTDRRAASSLLVVTGHEDPKRPLDRVKWEHVATAADTIVVLMGARRLGDIAEALIAGGRPAETPAALVEWGTTPSQRTVTAPLAEIAARAADAGFGSPATLVVGDVVALRDRIAWFDRRPLHGARVLVTRALDQSAPLVRALEERGAAVMLLPVLAFAPPASTGALDDAVLHLGRYRWLILTSANAVDALFDRVRACGLDARALAPVRVCAVGPATRARLEAFGIVPDLEPEEATGEGVLAALTGALGAAGVAEARFLMPRAAEGREVIPDGIVAAGGAIDVVTAYRTICPDDTDPAPVVQSLQDGALHAVTLTSPSAVRNLVGRLGEGGRALLARTALVTIGPTTSTAVRSLGLPVAAEASPHTAEGLVDAVVRALA